MTQDEMMQAALQAAKDAQKQPGMIRLPDGNWYDYGTDMEEYLLRQCAMLADQNISISAQDLYDIQPESERRYSVQQIQHWLNRHPHYAVGLY